MRTRCPHCRTLFNVTVMQLRAARGTVRCGHCLGAFDALVGLRDGVGVDGPPPSADAEASPVGEVGPPVGEGVAAEHYDERDLYQERSTHRPWMLADAGERTEADGALAGPAGLVTDEGSIPPSRPDVGAEHRSTSEADDEDRAPAAATVSEPPEDHDLAALRSLHTIVPSFERAVADPRPHEWSEEGSSELEPNAVDAWWSSSDSDETRGEPEEWEQGDELDEVPDVLRADVSRRERIQSRSRPVLYGIAGLLLLAGLALQYAWFMPDDMLRRYPQSRALLESWCPRIGCLMPERHDPSTIRVASRDYRGHPKYEGALLVTAALVNSAAFIQPYPRMQFSLFNVNGQIIATRIFTPSEYLGAGVAENAGMRPRVPLQIKLEILAPDEAVVSFEFRFL